MSQYTARLVQPGHSQQPLARSGTARRMWPGMLVEAPMSRMRDLLLNGSSSRPRRKTDAMPAGPEARSMASRAMAYRSACQASGDSALDRPVAEAVPPVPCPAGSPAGAGLGAPPAAASGAPGPAAGPLAPGPPPAPGAPPGVSGGASTM